MAAEEPAEDRDLAEERQLAGGAPVFVADLGRVVGVGSDCIKFTDFGPPPSYAFDNGELTLTAANGDQLKLTYRGTFIPTAQLPVYAISGLFDISGGTGRFANATGSGLLEGTENTQTFQGQLELSGRISY